MAGAGKPGLPRRRDPDLAGLAAFTLGPQGQVTSWSVTAERLFGHLEKDVIGRDVRDVLMTGPGQRELMAQALERTGDHATNLAEELFRLIQGRSLRHVAKKRIND